MNHAAAVLIPALAVSGAAAARAAHTPVFTWQVRGDVNYRQGIYDGADLIAVLDMSTVDEPMQALMFFQQVPRPILLRQVKLAPGGKPLVEAIQLYWKGRDAITTVLDGLTVEGSGTERLTVTFTVKDPADAVRVVRTLTVTYDAALDSYVYDLRDRATIATPEKVSQGGPVSFEICDPWLHDCPAPSQRFPGMWKGRYRQYAYESRDGRVISIPHNHVVRGIGQVTLKPDGVFAALYEPDGCPAIQFLDGTADRTRISMCPWGYDIHIGYPVPPEALAAPITPHFRFFRLPDARARAMNAAAVIPPVNPSLFNGAKEIPMYERVSSFEKGLVIEQPHAGDLDPWFWVPRDEKGAVWDRTVGRTGASSLKIEKETDGVATWYAICEGQGYFTEPWTPCKGYEISVWVKTKDVSGPGASLGACYHIPNVTPEWPVACSERVAGTKEWSRLTLRMGPPPKDTSIMSLHLQLTGKGACWFDDLEVKMLK
ncbi:MAG: hypothetical protein HY321_02695 [Armatimonadetes bacterium]|nr:hypothetical protein [Armatimonadota bacterium]